MIFFDSSPVPMQFVDKAACGARASYPPLIPMAQRRHFSPMRRNPKIRFALFVTGVFLIIISPIIGILPGPGFLILFPIGLMLCLQNSNWAKRRYVRFKARHARYGAWADKAMRRASAARRRARKGLESLGHDD